MNLNLALKLIVMIGIMVTTETMKVKIERDFINEGKSLSYGEYMTYRSLMDDQAQHEVLLAMMTRKPKDYVDYLEATIQGLRKLMDLYEQSSFELVGVLYHVQRELYEPAFDSGDSGMRFTKQAAIKGLMDQKDFIVGQSNRLQLAIMCLGNMLMGLDSITSRILYHDPTISRDVIIAKELEKPELAWIIEKWKNLYNLDKKNTYESLVTMFNMLENLLDWKNPEEAAVLNAIKAVSNLRDVWRSKAMDEKLRPKLVDIFSKKEALKMTTLLDFITWMKNLLRSTDNFRDYSRENRAANINVDLGRTLDPGEREKILRHMPKAH